MRVPFADLGLNGKPIESEVMAAVAKVLASGAYIGGPEVEAFEREFAAFCGAAEAVGVDSGTHALTFALLAAGVRPGDEVITSPMSFIATAEAITHAGGVPVFADVNPWTGLIDVSLAAEAITPRTKAIVPVHLYGQPAEMDPLLRLARNRGIAVVEDACQAHGAEYRGRRSGALGDIAAFSFYPSKNLGACGEGGAVTAGSPALARSVRLLRDHGQSERYHHETIGYNGRLDAIQAAILRVKLRFLDEWNSQRRKNALLYNQALGEIPGVLLPPHPLHVLPVYHLYVIQVEYRDRVRERLAARGIETGLHYPVPIHLQPAYRSLGYRAGNFPAAERLASRVLSLPLYPELTEAQIAYVAECLRESL
jgi:dTDP-4-amino-4,6-dideoxygalactose transaminase